MKLIINIPAYNEAQVIGKTIQNIPRSYDGIDEVLIQVIDDGSHDGTADIAREAGADIVVVHKTNRKLGFAFNSAVRSALKNDADIMVNIDADGQFDSSEISHFLTPILKGEADIVIGDRFTSGKADGIPFIKKFLNTFAAHIVGEFLDVKIDDLTCGFRSHSREALLRLNSVTGFTYTQETIIDAIGKNLKLKWIPVNVQYFQNRKSRIVKSVWRFVSNSTKIIIKAVRDVRPMKFFGIPGLFLIFISLIIFGFFLHLYLSTFKITPYYNYLLTSTILFLIGLQFLVFALIADMIKTNRQLTEELMYRMRKEKYNKKS
ncbi:MAG: glycosyl transferase family 2 [Candidatus Moraniibacteriota bacterium]|nr:MAG: glycosyl transferase family 2 [Candidatus Moranbacteria bacterium]